MPTIPEYQPQVQQAVGPQIQVNEQAPIEAFGGGQALAGAQAAQGLLGETEKQFDAAKKQADNTRVMHAFDQLTQTKNQLLYDPTSGAMTKKGQDAANVAQDYGDQFKSAADDIQNNLSNDDQRVMFQRVRARVGDEFGQTLEKHTYAEIASYQNEVHASALKTAQDDATLNYTLPGKVPQAIQTVSDLARQQAAAQGIHDPDVVQQYVRQATSKVYTGVLERMLATDDPGARGFYLAAQGDMTAEDRQKVDVTLKTASMTQESQAKGDQIMAKYQDLPSALTAARELPPGELRQKVTTYIKDTHADQRTAKDDYDRNRFDQASDIVEKSKGTGQIPATLLAGMPSSQQKALEDRARQLRTGETVDPNGPAYYSFRTMAAQDPNRFKALNLNTVTNQVTPSEKTTLLNIQEDLNQGKSNKDLDTHRSAQAIADSTARAVGLKGRITDSDKLDQFNVQFYKQIDAATTRKGKPLNDEEMQGIADQMVLPAARGMFGGVNKYSFELHSGDDVPDTLTDIRDVRPTLRDQAVAAMTARNIKPTDENILYYVNRLLRNQRGQ